MAGDGNQFNDITTVGEWSADQVEDLRGALQLVLDRNSKTPFLAELEAAVVTKAVKLCDDLVSTPEERSGGMPSVEECRTRRGLEQWGRWLHRPTSLREDTSAGRVPLREQAAASRALRVDEGKGIIYSVKVINSGRSANGRDYPAGVLQAAVAAGLYEGVPVYIEHARGNGVERKLGRLVGAYWDGKGVSANLVYLKSHPLSPRLVEAARSAPWAFGLSHEATGEVRRGPDGVPVVVKLTAVRSVDLVDSPASTSGLSESRRPDACPDAHDIEAVGKWLHS